jgi:myo-inositol 2-dehydrogenase / D-chiro-inositol 1-dehydrogenase
MGLTHLRALAASDKVRIAAVADPSPAARACAEEIASTVGTYADVAEALDTNVDGVLIAAPSTVHRAVVARCAQRGLPILCEKPCGTTVGDIDAAADAADSGDLAGGEADVANVDARAVRARDRVRVVGLVLPARRLRLA